MSKLAAKTNAFITPWGSKPGDIQYVSEQFHEASFQILSQRVRGLETEQDDLTAVQRCGYRDLDDYWQIPMTTDSMSTLEFISLLSMHHTTKARHDREAPTGQDEIGDHIRRNLKVAISIHGQKWFDPSDGKAKDVLKLRLRPREAAEWFLRDPFRKDTLPASLRKYLEGKLAQDQPVTAEPLPEVAQPATQQRHGGPATASKRKTGPTPKKSQRIEAEMRQMDRVRLNEMKHEEMANQFKASASTCNLVRRRVLSKLAPD